MNYLTHLSIPIGVLNAGLAGTVLALLVATVQNRWSLRVFFILALRLAIGWHFLFEGLHKLHSHYVGETETNRPFTSRAYFEQAEGPLGPYVRQQIGDPEELMKQKTYPESTPPALANLHDPNLLLAVGAGRVTDAEAVKAVPQTLAEEWNRFVKDFTEKYRLNDTEKAKLAELSTAALAKYGRWVLGVEGRESKVKYVAGDVALTAPQRLDYIRKRRAEIEELEKHRASDLGDGASPEVIRLKEARAAAALARTTLIADADAFLADLKKEAFAVVVAIRFNTDAAPKPSEKISAGIPDNLLDDHMLGVIPPAKAPEGANFDTLPTEIRSAWSKYWNTFESFYPDAQSAAPAYETAKLRVTNWFYDRDEFTGQPKPGFGPLANNFRDKIKARKATKSLIEAARGSQFGKTFIFAAAVKADQDATAARKAILDALDAKYADLKTLTTNALPPDVAKGPIDPPEKKSPITQLDFVTMWVITAVGVMLLAGLFTPLACLVGVGFLVLTYLTHPPFPWLALPPGTEGNPVFVNKNVIEALALMVIFVHPTGRWMGLDALLHRMIFRNALDPR